MFPVTSNFPAITKASLNRTSGDIQVFRRLYSDLMVNLHHGFWLDPRWRWIQSPICSSLTSFAGNLPLPWPFSPLVFSLRCRPMFGRYQGRRKSAIAFDAIVESFKSETMVEVCRLAGSLGRRRNCGWATRLLSLENYLSPETCKWRPTERCNVEINFINI